MDIVAIVGNGGIGGDDDEEEDGKQEEEEEEDPGEASIAAADAEKPGPLVSHRSSGSRIRPPALACF